MKICGIDPSMNSTGKCILELDDATLDIINAKFYGYNTVNKRCFQTDRCYIHPIGTQYTKKNMFERQDLAYTFLKLDMEEVKHIAFEGYAYGKKKGTSNLVQLGEFIGGMKKTFYDMGKGIVIYSPNTVKMFATGNGAADKADMVFALKKEYPHLYPEEFDQLPQYEDPHSDMCDAFWIAETLRCHIKYDMLGSDSMDKGTVAFLESKSTKKTHSIVDTPFYKKCQST